MIEPQEIISRMDPFIQYLVKSKDLIGTLDLAKTKIHIVMGNESCDLDSMISTLALGYFHHLQSQFDVVIPILNIPQDEFSLRTENYYVLKKIGLNQDLLVFRDNLNLKEIQNCGLLSVSLVDHHSIRPEDQFIVASVIEIFDHRPIDPNTVWDETKTKIRIEQVGSCSTLIAEQMLNVNLNTLSPILAELLYYVIIFDTIAFNTEAGRVKELDVVVSDKLKNEFNLNQDSKAIFHELWTAHNDVSHLTPKELLSKDLKIVEGLPVPGLPMLNVEYLKLPKVVEGMSLFCEEKLSTTMVIIGLFVVDQEVYRDIAVFNSNRLDTGLGDKIIINLKNALGLKGYDFCLEEIYVDLPNNIKCFKQKNVKLTRKHILPIIKDTIVNYREKGNKK